MKTAESSIKNDLGKLLVDLAISKVDHWARTEFNNLRYEPKFPVCLQISNKNWIVGTHTITHLAQHKYTVTNNDKIVHTFYSKQAAIFYAVFTYCKHYKTADKLLLNDKILAKTNDDLEFYSKKLSKKTTDYFKRDLWFIRYTDAKTRYISAREELEKTLTSAKYNKVWSGILSAN
jgi:hypothetical protein